MEIMSLIPDKSVNLILTDPPYFLPAKHYQTKTKFNRNFSDLGILEYFFKNTFKEFSRIIKDDGFVYVFCDGQSYPLFYYYLYPFCKSVRPLIWDKKISILGYSWRHQHEIIIFAEKSGAKAIPTGDGDILRYSAVKVDERQHPAEKPISLLEALIKKSSNSSNVILDAFAGSLTTAIACKNLNRKYICIEISKDYCDIGIKRIQSLQPKLFKESELCGVKL